MPFEDAPSREHRQHLHLVEDVLFGEATRFALTAHVEEVLEFVGTEHAVLIDGDEPLDTPPGESLVVGTEPITCRCPDCDNVMLLAVPRAMWAAWERRN